MYFMNNLTCELFWDIVSFPSRHCSLPYGVSLQSATCEILLAIIFLNLEGLLVVLTRPCTKYVHKNSLEFCSFSTELNFNKCPLQPVFDSKKGFPGHLLHAKKNKHEITNPKRSGTLLQKCFHVWSYLWLTCNPCWTCVSFVWSYLWLTFDPCWNPNNICFWE